MDKVSVMRCTGYDTETLCAIVEQQFADLEKDQIIIKKGDTVVVKPNLIMRRRPEEATTTHPELVGAIIRAAKKRGGNVVIAESPGGPYTKAALRTVYDGTGMTEIAQREGAQLNYDLGVVTVPTNGGKIVSAFELLEPVVKADVVISAAKLKTHGQMTFSGAVKNLFGTVPGLKKPEFHYRFPQKPDFAAMIVDLCETVKATICFIDGVVGMEGNGPTGGSPRQLGAILASLNPHALDLVTCALVGFSPNEIPTLSDAVARGLCPADAGQVDVIGDGADLGKVRFKAPESISMDFAEKLPKFLRKPIGSLVTPRPAIVKSGCIGCGKCAESCPQHTIAIKNGKAIIDYSNCIRCYCCHEMCPKKAIRVKSFRLFGM